MTRQRTRRAPIGVLAKTKNLADSLARELGIRMPVLLSPHIIVTPPPLGVLFVDESAWPLDPTIRARLLPLLERHRGDILKVSRYDPRTLTFEENL